jgi:hypothetical protein
MRRPAYVNLFVALTATAASHSKALRAKENIGVLLPELFFTTAVPS